MLNNVRLSEINSNAESSNKKFIKHKTLLALKNYTVGQKTLFSALCTAHFYSYTDISKKINLAVKLQITSFITIKYNYSFFYYFVICLIYFYLS